MSDCNFRDNIGDRDFLEITLETFVSNLVSLIHSNLQILDKTHSFMEICHYSNSSDLLLRSIAAIRKTNSACMVYNA